MVSLLRFVHKLAEGIGDEDCKTDTSRGPLHHQRHRRKCRKWSCWVVLILVLVHLAAKLNTSGYWTTQRYIAADRFTHNVMDVLVDTCTNCGVVGGCPDGTICGVSTCGGKRSCIPRDDYRVTLAPVNTSTREQKVHYAVIGGLTLSHKILLPTQTKSATLHLYPNASDPDQPWEFEDYASLGVIHFGLYVHYAGPYGNSIHMQNEVTWGADYNASVVCTERDALFQWTDSEEATPRTPLHIVDSSNTACFVKGHYNLCDLPTNFSVDVRECDVRELAFVPDDANVYLILLVLDHTTSYGVTVSATAPRM
jgi:hypothetical protein